MSDYVDIANRSWDDIPEPKVLPVGSWKLRANSASYQPAKDAEKSPVVLFVYRPVEPMDDVDTDALEALGSNYDVATNRIFVRFFVNDGADWDRVRKHLAKHGVEAKGGIADTLKQVKGKDIIAYLGERSYTDNTGETRTDNEAQNFAPVEA